MAGREQDLERRRPRRRLGTRSAAALVVLATSGLLLPLASAAARVRTQNPPPDASADDGGQVAPIYYYLRSTSTETGSPEALLQAYMDRHTSRDYLGAVEMAHRLIDAVPDRPVGYYNLACSLARLRRNGQAFDALELAIDHGWRNVEHTQNDPDLETLRQESRYRQLVARIKRLRVNERITPGPLRTDDWNDVVEDLRLQVPPIIERYHVPGVTVALVHDGSLVWNEAFGLSDAVERSAMQPEMGFKLGAPAHLFALLAALQQETNGSFSVAKIFEMGEEYDRHDPGRLARDFDARPRTYVFGVSRQDRSGDAAAARNAAYTDRIRSVSPEGWPSYQPQVTNFVLLQTAIEQASGETFYNFCRNHLFAPLLLDDTDFIRQDARGPNPATGHTMLGTPIVSTVDKTWRTPAIYTTAPDMGRLIEALINRQLVGADPAAPGKSLDDSLGAIAPKLCGLGFGVHFDRTAEGPCIQLADNTGGLGCLLRWYPDAGLGIAIMFNAETGPDAALRIAHLALGGS